MRNYYSLKDEAFLSQMENLIAETTNRHRSRLSPVELYALRYEFMAETAVKKKTIIRQISVKELVSLFKGDKTYTMLMHEQKGLLFPDETFSVFTKNNTENFIGTDLLASLNKRMTFFIGAFNSKRPNRKFVVDEILVYIPSKKDTTMYLDKLDLDDELFQAMFETDAQIIDSIFQDGVILSKTPAVVVPDFEKEFFVFTKMKVDGVTFVFHYIP